MDQCTYMYPRGRSQVRSKTRARSIALANGVYSRSGPRARVLHMDGVSWTDREVRSIDPNRGLQLDRRRLDRCSCMRMVESLKKFNNIILYNYIINIIYIVIRAYSYSY